MPRSLLAPDDSKPRWGGLRAFSAVRGLTGHEKAAPICHVRGPASHGRESAPGRGDSTDPAGTAVHVLGAEVGDHDPLIAVRALMPRILDDPAAAQVELAMGVYVGGVRPVAVDHNKHVVQGPTQASVQVV